MRLIDRYLFGQLVVPTLLATAALTVVAVLTEALSAIGVMINQGQSPLVFARIVLLALPQLIVLILPVAVLVAGVMTINRLHRDNELAVCFASGMSRWRVIAPAIKLASMLALICLVITLWIQPLCYRALRDTLEDVRTDVAAALIKPGRFTHPSLGTTVYAQSLDEDGLIHNLFIDQISGVGQETTIMAREGRLQRHGDTPRLVMRSGANEVLSPTGALTFLSFDQYVLDLRPLMPAKPVVRYKLSDRYLAELIRPDSNDPWEQANRGKMLAEAHSRLAMPLYVIAFMFLALAAVVGGGFSRFGYSARIAVAGGAALVARSLGLAVEASAGAHPALNVLQYAAPLLLCGVCAAIIFDARARTSRSPPLRPAPRAVDLALSR